MVPAHFDPYRAQRRLHWRNRWQQWRGRPGESAFHAVSLLGAVALIVALLGSRLDELSRMLIWMLDAWPLQCAVVWCVLIALDHSRARRRQLTRWRNDWFSAQPVASRVRRMQRLQQFVARVLVQMLLLGILLGLAHAHFAEALVALTVLGFSAGVGHVVGQKEAVGSTAMAARKTPFVSRGTGRIWRWQLIEAGATLAPRRIAWMLPVVLLVPRGPAMMALIALGLVLLLAALTAWHRMLAVVPIAHAWLREQPLAARRWLLRCALLPLLSLTLGSALLSLAASQAGLRPLLWICALALPMIGLLQMSIVAAERHQPRRIGWVLTLHLVLLAASVQAMPMVLPLLWLAQIGWFAHKALSR